MKKFLSLVLALIMTMSLVTISAGATEYRDLTDKDEIQYEEAVAVLNRIGVITGYEDGSFRPETELTRGAAAKIIVSLMIGPDAASALPNNASPYPDVPAGHTFAGVIGYCKTAGYISGYGDGTFKPANPLTGYAFAKMLLGAIGYKSNVEGFVDTGWTMNVARIGNVAGLFDRLDFDGAKAVTRDEACQLALNTLKATMVDYGGSNTVVSSNGQVLTVQGSKAQYVTSNNRDINANINRRVISATNNELTLEFGEEHFKDLRLEHDRYDPAYDIYGRPSNEWSYKKVTVGTFPLPADFTFTKQMAHREDTVASKEKALGLRGYDTYSTDHRTTSGYSTVNGVVLGGDPFADATQITINGYGARVHSRAYTNSAAASGTLEGNLYAYDAYAAGIGKDNAPSLAEICDLTDNGVTVEVYVCPVDADFITNVVVIRTQLMKVKTIGSDYVALETIDPDSQDPRKEGNLGKITGYNAFAIDTSVVDVKDNNYDAYNTLKDMKAGDRVAVVPYTTDQARTWEVGEVYTPETASGTLTKVDLYANTTKSDGNAIALTVGGTSYPISEWNKDVIDADGYQIKATRKDVTVYLDKLGNVMWADEIGNSDDWMIVGDYYQGTNAITGKVDWFVHGWTIGNEEIDLDLGTIRGDAEKYAPGELVRYQIAKTGNGEYTLTKPNFSGIRQYKNGTTVPTLEPRLEKSKVLDNGGSVKYYTGEGIYEVSQYAKTVNNNDRAFSIATGNSDLALEGYTYETVNTATGSKTTRAFQTANGPKWIDKTANDTPEWTASPNPTGGQEANHLYNYNYTSYDGVKFIFVSFDQANGNVETIDFQSNVQNVSAADLRNFNSIWRNVGTNGSADAGKYIVSAAEAYVNDSGKIKAVVIKTDSAEANLNNIAVITDVEGSDTWSRTVGAESTEQNGFTRKYRIGPKFDEELTGTFDRPYNVGDIVTIRKDGDRLIAKNFHWSTYNNGNPDVLVATNISEVKTLTGSTSKSAFLVGAGATNYVTRQDGISLKGGNVAILNKDNVLGDETDDSWFFTRDDRAGLITVNSDTIFVDQRTGHRDDEIDSLDDLLDRDLTTVKVTVLLNGKVNTSNFRHAYAIVINQADAKISRPKTPEVTINAYNGNLNNTVYEVTYGANATVELTAVIKDQLKNYPDGVTYQWQISDNGTNGWRNVGTNASTLTYNISAARDYYFRVTVVGRDNSKVDFQTTTGTSPVFHVKGVTAAAAAGAVYFTGDKMKGTEGAEIIANATVTAAAGGVDSGAVLQLPEWADGSGTASKFDYQIWDASVASSVPLAISGAAGVAQGSLAAAGTHRLSIDTTGTKLGATTNAIVATGSYKVEITKMWYNAVKVKFVDATTKADVSDQFNAAALNMVTPGNVSLTYNGTASAGTLTLTYKSGLKDSATHTATLDVSTNPGKTASNFFTAADVATGTDYVVVEVAGLNAVQAPYSITLENSNLSQFNLPTNTGSNAITLASIPTSIPYGQKQNVDVSVTLGTALAYGSGNKPIRVTLAMVDEAGAEETKTVVIGNNSGTVGSCTFAQVGKNVTISVKNVEEIDTPRVAGYGLLKASNAADWTGTNALDITFSEAGVTVEAAGSGIAGSPAAQSGVTMSLAVVSGNIGTATVGQVAANTSWVIPAGALSTMVDGVKCFSVAAQSINCTFNATPANATFSLTDTAAYT